MKHTVKSLFEAHQYAGACGDDMILLDELKALEVELRAQLHHCEEDIQKQEQILNEEIGMWNRQSVGFLLTNNITRQLLLRELLGDVEATQA